MISPSITLPGADSSPTLVSQHLIAGCSANVARVRVSRHLCPALAVPYCAPASDPPRSLSHDQSAPCTARPYQHCLGSSCASLTVMDSGENFPFKFADSAHAPDSCLHPSQGARTTFSIALGQEGAAGAYCQLWTDLCLSELHLGTWLAALITSSAVHLHRRLPSAISSMQLAGTCPSRLWRCMDGSATSCSDTFSESGVRHETTYLAVTGAADGALEPIGEAGGEAADPAGPEAAEPASTTSDAVSQLPEVGTRIRCHAYKL